MTEKKKNNRWRLGNFRVKENGNYLKASDFGGLWKLEVHKGSIIGMNLLFLCAHDQETADIYLKLLWAVGNIVPDSRYLEDLWKSYQDRLGRMPKEEQSDEKAIEEIQRLEAFLNMPQETLEKELDLAAEEYEKAMAEAQKKEPTPTSAVHNADTSSE